MTGCSDDRHLVMHATAIKDHGDVQAIAGLVGMEPDHAAALLKQAEEGGRVVEAKGRYLLSPAGRMILENQYSRHYAGLAQDEAFWGAYERFETLNTELKQCITDWQTREVGGEKIKNDHSDPDYDDAVLDRLDAVHDRVEAILGDLAKRVARLKIYAGKLEAALEKAEGDPAWVSSAKIDSYHTVWFELHEDLLRLLGQERRE